MEGSLSLQCKFHASNLRGVTLTRAQGNTVDIRPYAAGDCERTCKSIRTFENLHFPIPWNGRALSNDCCAKLDRRMPWSSVLCAGSDHQYSNDFGSGNSLHSLGQGLSLCLDSLLH